MKKASISILKAHLSRYVDAVKSGEEVIVTERGRPVARLSGLAPGGETHGRAAQLVREGRMRAPLRPMTASAAAPEPAPSDPAGRGLAILLEERSEGR